MSATSVPHNQNANAVLAVILVSYLMIILDVSIVITGLPRIRAELGFTPAMLGWVQSIYTLTFGGFLLLGARAGDILGRRRTFQIGLAIFSLASVAIGLSQTAGWMVAGRAIQGFGAAILAPSTLALLSTSFAEGRERNRATAWYGSMAGIGAAIGLVLGGVLADMLSWRVGFFINLPIGIAMAVLGSRYIEETEAQPGRFDLIGAITSTAGFGILIFGVLHSAERGWADPITPACILAGLAIIATFVWYEARAAQPIMPLRLFNSHERVGAYAARFLYVAAMVGFFFFTTQYMQGAEGFSALQAGLGYLPMTVVNFLVAIMVPGLLRWLASRTVLLAGTAITGVGMFWLSRVGIGSGYLTGVGLPMVLIGAGQGLCFGPMTSAGIAGIERRDAGAASGVVNVAHQMGLSFGLAVLIAAAALGTRGETGEGAITHGFRIAMTTGSGLILASLIVSVVLLPRRPGRLA